MNDILPDEIPVWQHIEGQVKQLLVAYGYDEIRMPIVEQTALFERSIGEITDIVEKEMYTFSDKKTDSLTLRPEGTAGCVRAANQHGLLNQIQRLWYIGPMFRYERPQKGRQRQFNQVGVECFGVKSPDVDAEMIFITARLWRLLGVDRHVRLELNSIGSLQARMNYRDSLIEFLTKRRHELDEDSQRRLETNPLRILDSKNEKTQDLLVAAPSLVDYLDDESKDHFQKLRLLLDSADIKYTVNPQLVRGLDYYNKTVFEWITDSLGAQGTICGGGRYDGLVDQLGGKPTSAVGFAMGLERLVLLVKECQPQALIKDVPDVYFVASGDRAEIASHNIAESLRNQIPTLKMIVHCGGGSFKSQMKKANKSGASYALILGNQEVENGTVGFKPLRIEDKSGIPQEGQQQTVAVAELSKFFEQYI
tara:strand:+ start:113 stop:1378 length:1266 start_codon:yes stop_codon:yes gene_type:complete